MTFLIIVLVLQLNWELYKGTEEFRNRVFYTDEEGEEQFITNLESTSHNIGLYGSNTIDLDDTTSLNFSARWNWASLEMNDQNLEQHLRAITIFGELTQVLE